MTQVGEHEVVIEVGARALDKWEARAMRRDILLAMALAHLGLASEAFEAPGHVRGASPVCYDAPRWHGLESCVKRMLQLVAYAALMRPPWATLFYQPVHRLSPPPASCTQAYAKACALSGSQVRAAEGSRGADGGARALQA